MPNSDQPAFPVASSGAVFDGLTKRELFVLGAMIGFCANPELNNLSPDSIASIANDQADAQLAALEAK